MALGGMAWAAWLAVPILATSLAAVWVWWRGHREIVAARLDTPGAMRAHEEFLAALTIPARSLGRPAPVISVDEPLAVASRGAWSSHNIDG